MKADLRIGSVIACSAVASDSVSGEFEGDQGLRDLALKAGASTGRCLTVRLPLVSKAEKLAAAEKTGCSVCEMEAWHEAAAASQAGVPFLALKAVSDALSDALPDFRRFMDATGAADTKKVALYLASRPDEAARAARFFRGAAAAMKELAGILRKMWGSPNGV